MGIALFPPMPNVKSLVVIHAADMDCVSTYPTTEEVCNISKRTTLRELGGIRGIDEWTKRAAGINLTGGKNNAWEITSTIMGFPRGQTLLDAYRKEKESVV
jgi:hypothetical protein